MLNRLSKYETIFFITLFVALAALFFHLPSLGLYSNEEGAKFVQMKNFALHGSLSIPYPAQQMGFTADDLTKEPGYFESKRGELRAITPPLFPFLTSLFYPLFGDRAVHLLPLAFFFLTAIMLKMALGLVMERSVLQYLLLLAFLGSPVALNIFGFSEVPAALFLESLALYGIVRYVSLKQAPIILFGSSFSMGLTLFLCPAFLFMAAAWTIAGTSLLAAGKKSREAGLFAAGAAAAAVLWMVSEAMLYGAFPGPYLESLAPWLALSPIRVLIFLGAFVLSAALLCEAQKGSLPNFPMAGAWFVSLLLLSAVVLVTSARFSLIPFLLLFPTLLFAFWGLPASFFDAIKKEKVLLGLILSAAILLCLTQVATVLKNESDYVRLFYLPVIPVAIVVMGIESRRIFAAPAVSGLLVFAVAVSIAGGYEWVKDPFMKYTDYNARRVAFLEQNSAKGDVVVFTGAPLMEHAGPLFFERAYLVAPQEVDFERILQTLQEHNVSNLYLWSAGPALVARWGNPYDKESYRTFPMASSCQTSCNSNFYLFRVDVDAAIGRMSQKREEREP